MEIFVEFDYGALAPKLEEQAKKQGYTLGEKAEYFEMLKCSLAMLWVAGVLSDSQDSRAREKLDEMVIKALRKRR